jgi:hypothetical protein
MSAIAFPRRRSGVRVIPLLCYLFRSMPEPAGLAAHMPGPFWIYFSLTVSDGERREWAC